MKNNIYFIWVYFVRIGQYLAENILNLMVQNKIKISRKSPLKLSKWSSLQCILLIIHLVFIYLQLEIYKISSWNMIFTLYLKVFWHKRKVNNFDPNNIFLGIATNIPVWLKTAFVLQGHICHTHLIFIFLSAIIILYLQIFAQICF